MSDNNPERLSATSKAYDRGQKGYLSDIEKAVRGYDTDNDGKISTEEVFRIVEDVYRERSQKQSYKKFFQWSVVAMVILLVGNFGLVWATVALTKEVKSEDGKLEDADTGNILQTRSSSFPIAPTDGESGGARRNLAPSYLDLDASYTVISYGTVSADFVNKMIFAASIGETFRLTTPSNRKLAESGTRNLKENGSVTWILRVGAYEQKLLNNIKGPERMLEEHGDGSTTITTFYIGGAPEFDDHYLYHGRQLITDCPLPVGNKCDLYFAISEVENSIG